MDEEQELHGELGLQKMSGLRLICMYCDGLTNDDKGQGKSDGAEKGTEQSICQIKAIVMNYDDQHRNHDDD